MTPKPFRIEIPDADLADLDRRLRRTRWPDEVAGSGWNYGADLGFMRALLTYWEERFDWRAQERVLNALPQFVAPVDGHDIHFIHQRGKGENPLPLIITHGWPSSIVEFAKIIPLLTDPVTHGGSAEDAFDVIVPSLPGFGFSARPTLQGMTPAAISSLWATLMTDVLGYPRFCAHGGDIGGEVANFLADQHARCVTAIHTMTPRIIKVQDDFSDAECRYAALFDAWLSEEGAYCHQQNTRPQTLSFGLADSPVGLAAWIVEKWHAWSDCNQNVLSRFSMDELLTNISIYWFTNTISSSIRIYYEDAHAPPPVPQRTIDVPARLFLSCEAVNRCPREYGARSFSKMSYGLASSGGHFMAAEEPALLAEDIRTYFRQFRHGC